MSRPIAAIAGWLGGPSVLLALLLLMAHSPKTGLGLVLLAGCAVWPLIAGGILASDLKRLKAYLQTASPSEIRLVTPGLSRLVQPALRTIAVERRSRHTVTADADFSHALLDRMPDALFQFGGPLSARRVVWRNPAAAQAYGAEEAALLRHPLLREALAEAETVEHPVRTTLALAAPIARDLDAIVIRAGRTDQPAPLYLLLTDRTREHGLNRMRADFVANASHELRTPLTSLIGFIETLRGPALGDAEAQRHFLAIMAEQAERMQQIIGDLLSLSRIEMTEHQPPSDQVDIEPLLRQVAGFMEPILRNGHARLVLDLPAALPAVPGDSGQLGQVFGNLIDNAVKYSALKHRLSGSTIEVTARSTPSDDFPQPGIVVIVTDNGPGIAREHLPRLTERFYRADKGRSRAVGGTGLGLAIVKHVVSRHRGRLVIESVLDEGTTCRVWLPAGIPDRP
ncbi:MAG: sensor histidine kinase [Acidiphilium sp.]